MTDRPKCVCCDHDLSFRWSDTHGVGVCSTCMMPYKIFHYEGPDGQQRRVEKPPECAIKTEWQPVAKRYWTETKLPVFPGCFDMGFIHGRTYSGATKEDCDAFRGWMKAHESELPRANQ